jgi:hypothetical protein
MNPIRDFIGEDDLLTFEGWLNYQAIDPTTQTVEGLAEWRRIYGEICERRETARKVGRMKLRPQPNEFRYAVAVRENDDLWLVFWVRRSPRGEFFFFQPRGDGDWNPHTSYHIDGTLHTKSHDATMLPAQRRQPLTGPFRGLEPIGSFGGHGPKTVGATCDPTDFTAVFEIPSGILGPVHGSVVVDLVEPGCAPLDWPGTEIDRRLFADVSPNVLIRIFS